MALCTGTGKLNSLVKPLFSTKTWHTINIFDVLDGSVPLINIVIVHSNALLSVINFVLLWVGT